MEQPVRNEGGSTSTPEPGGIPPHFLSRKYEDYLDWLENQRRDRIKRGGRHRIGFGVLSVFATAVSLAGVMFRRR
jgi:hypothetical protein